MKFDYIIIGGGLSGLTCGIRLSQAGKKVAIISAGQSTLHFGSGSLDLLGYDNEGNIADNPLDAIGRLNENHPYRKIGTERIERLAEEAKTLLDDCGIHTTGTAQKNHYRITPMGFLKPTWLTLENYATSPSASELPWKSVILANVAGFLDFPIEFISDGLGKLGTRTEVEIISIPALKARRHSPSEMRSANIAKILSSEETLNQIAEVLNSMEETAEAILMPAIVGLDKQDSESSLKQKVRRPLLLLPTLPPSVPGIRMQTMLQRRFTQLGGLYLMGSMVKEGHVENGKLEYVTTSTLMDERLTADAYILATGSFLSDGLKSNYERIFEPILNLDVTAKENRADWIDPNVFSTQPYQAFGVKTNERFQTSLEGQTLENMYAIGSVLGGHNAIQQADGTGVSMMTALAVANQLINNL